MRQTNGLFQNAQSWGTSIFSTLSNAVRSLGSSTTNVDRLVQSAFHAEQRGDWQTHAAAVGQDIKNGATIERMCQGAALVAALCTSPRLYGFTTLGTYFFLRNTIQTKAALKNFFDGAAKQVSEQGGIGSSTEKGYEISLKAGGAIGALILAWKISGGPATGLIHLLSTTLAIGAGMRTGVAIQHI